MKRLTTLAVFALFLFSGACGLIYEVLWCKQLGLIFGNTVHSLSAVLTAFMGGLALGSFVAGRQTHRMKRPLVIYGFLELTIGLYCALLPWVFSDHGPVVGIYRMLYSDSGSSALVAARFAISFFLLLIPTTFMGATLPVLSQFLVRSSKGMGRTVGALYAINSFGAVLGAAGTGFFLLPEIGKLNTNWVAVGLNVLLGAIAIFLGRRDENENPSPEVALASEEAATTTTAAATAPVEQAAISPQGLKLAVLAFGITGFSAMAIQICWTRAISLATGSSTYAFSLIVSVFILGLSLGGFWGARSAPRTRDPLALLGLVLLSIGFFCGAVTVLLGVSPIAFFFLLAWSSEKSWSVVLAAQTLGIGLLILIPTFLMGMTTPLTMQVASRFKGGAGRIVGNVYAINTLGAIIGSFFGGLVLLPALQIQSTLELMTLLYAVPGLVLFYVSDSRRRALPIAGTLALALPLVLIMGFAPRWDPRIMNGGDYLLRSKKRVEAARELRLRDALPTESLGKWVYHKEGASATVSVIEYPKGISLVVGGKPDASTYGDLTTQYHSMMIPALLHEKDPEDILVIGLGSGMTAGAGLALDSLKSMDIVEMIPEVVEGSYFFREHNGLTYVEQPRFWIETPKVRVLINDGRNHLLLTQKTYDIITSEPSNPWIAGLGSLFTREAFELSHARLKPGGIMCQWIQAYSLEANDFLSVVHTFGDVYKYIEVCWSGPGDFLLIGSDSPIHIPITKLREKLARPAIHKLMTQIQHDNVEEFMACFPGDNLAARELSSRARLHTDDNMLLEYSAPKALYKPTLPIQGHRLNWAPERIFGFEGIPDAERSALLQKIDLAVMAREHLASRSDLVGTLPANEQVVMRLAPKQRWALNLLSEKVEQKAMMLLTGDHDERTAHDPVAALNYMAANPNPDPNIRWFVRSLDAALLEEGIQLVDAGKGKEALEALSKISSREAIGQRMIFMARALALMQQYEKAADMAMKASADPAVSNFESGDVLVRILHASGKNEQALQMARELLNGARESSDKKAAPLYEIYALLLFEAKDLDGAFNAIHSAERLDKKFQYAQFEATIDRAKKDFPAAAEALRRSIAYRPMNEAALIDWVESLFDLAVTSGNEPYAAENALHRARRGAREITALFPDSPHGWELLCRTFLALEKIDTGSAAFYHGEATAAAEHAAAAEKGDVSKLPASVRNALPNLPTPKPDSK